ncbi:hypothetical protein BaRGS_00001078 [Batillaria attramentaria]|uniref:Uncharacterized protein n=1 Tax=Batillaria attramentaria TaxID=370345 RepID=A0ABD0M5V6_9CAEN
MGYKVDFPDPAGLYRPPEDRRDQGIGTNVDEFLQHPGISEDVPPPANVNTHCRPLQHRHTSRQPTRKSDHARKGRLVNVNVNQRVRYPRRWNDGPAPRLSPVPPTRARRVSSKLPSGRYLPPGTPPPPPIPPDDEWMN